MHVSEVFSEDAQKVTTTPCQFVRSATSEMLIGLSPNKITSIQPLRLAQALGIHNTTV
jgi:hypothetical protein